MTPEPPRRREIVVITKSEGSAPGRLDKVERVARTVSILAIPVVLAAGGWWIQSQLQDQAVKRDYVQLAVSVLREPDSVKISAGLRSWAADLLNNNSPTKLPDALLAELRAGRASFPAAAPLEYLSNRIRPVDSLQPAVAALARQLAAEAAKEGIVFKVTQTLVTAAEQDSLYARGRTAPGPRVTNARGGNSAHNYGLAFDVVIMKDGKPVWETAAYDRLGAIGRGLGLTWGGDWKGLRDVAHFELKLKQQK
jgi:D-alanyl-D-alanine carboxypeptidase-like protein